ncbi:uncharacterized protein MICPUCDRAFT_44601 [Micromonas pusilla CCMP1545]|uniref:proteasome endopeptidase complex n=1 Tax=Micromonas pusilla (strain CCMP1545) TaxID=564608 RepID=C1MYR7_MICPC|nr:uncharacterized protein MICPUCDRAFT_44601 [Micromonas pusilla CCMP1545]EEH54482.1 predicted protein [Micromonas pusilla CCMP1545]|eukprot:XP_003060832.1 predicted protein [Micromonas pusilla CCMP1545]
MDYGVPPELGVDPSASGGISTGTTIMACVYDGGVVLGADSRTSTGVYVANRASDKISSVTDNVWMCRSGSAADTQNVCAYVKNLVDQHNMERSDADPGMADVKLVANLTMQIAYKNKDKLSAGMIIGGWDSKRGPQVYGIPLGGSLLPCPFTIGGSGGAYIYGWCDDTWKEGMSREEAEAWVTRAISLAITMDSSSGGVIRLVTIDDKGCNKQMLEPYKHLMTYGELPVKRVGVDAMAA